MGNEKKELELYIHVPFCIKKCQYCDFLSAPSSKGERQEYAESLCRQIRTYGELAKAYHVVSIFVGGGTPSILDKEQLLGIFDAVRDTFTVDGDAEITIEVNPGTVTEEKLKAYLKAGINRLSIGLQSAKNEELQLLGRIHTYEEFLSTYGLAREMGFGNINVDLMSAIPRQTVEGWERTLKKVLGLRPEHISAYSLIIEEGTPFFERYGKGGHVDELPSEEEERRMYWRTAEILRGYGYCRYEISNYALPGYECRHNLGYWNRTEYLGIGTGAASLMDNRRWNYGEEPVGLSVREQMEEFMFLGLRKMEGVSKAKFEESFGRGME
ncbi:radical SAM family heme chaperone HemW, partial [Sporofaciens musculi]|uniref:radical SAM family heme chaperone HemW n=1 Tax=Sporofaciens musculi TaxID=2681861 RepID=UPI0025A1752E